MKRVASGNSIWSNGSWVKVDAEPGSDIAEQTSRTWLYAKSGLGHPPLLPQLPPLPPLPHREMPSVPLPFTSTPMLLLPLVAPRAAGAPPMEPSTAASGASLWHPQFQLDWQQQGNLPATLAAAAAGESPWLPQVRTKGVRRGGLITGSCHFIMFKLCYPGGPFICKLVPLLHSER